MREFFKCQECVDLLTDYLEGTLEEEIKEKLDDHLAGCAPCINFVRTFERSADLTKRLREQQVDVPLEVQGRLKSFLRQELITLTNNDSK